MRYVTTSGRLQARRAGRLGTIAVICAAALVVAGCSKSQTPRVNGNPAKGGPKQTVELIWKKTTSEWKVKLNGGGEENPATAKIDLARNTTGPTMFEVDIKGNGAPGFATSGALSVWEKSKAASQGSTQILGPIVSTDAKTLYFFDLNQGDAVTLYYGFNFDNNTSVDPIIDNGGHD